MSDFIALVQNQLHATCFACSRRRRPPGIAGHGTVSGGGTPIIVKINDDKKKLVGCEDSISKTHSKARGAPLTALIHGLKAKEICEYRHTGVVGVTAVSRLVSTKLF